MLADSDPRYLPAYSAGEAALYLQVPVSTVRYWSVGRNGYLPLIEPAQVGPLVLSFINLVELHVLSALRRKHRLSMPRIRDALNYVQEKLGLARPLVDRQFETDGADVFVQVYGNLINVSQKGQTAMRAILEAALVRVVRDASGQPMQLFPYTRTDQNGAAEIIVIDPLVAGGRATIHGTRIPVGVIAERYKAGESISDLAQGYSCNIDQIEEAIRYEMPLAA